MHFLLFNTLSVKKGEEKGVDGVYGHKLTKQTEEPVKGQSKWQMVQNGFYGG